MDYLLPVQKVPGQTRFDLARFIAFRDDTFDAFNSYLIQAVMTLPTVGVYVVADDVNRPDMICAAIYKNDTQYWALLMIYNGLWDFGSPAPFPVIPNGTKINCFSVNDLERLYFTIQSSRLANGN